MNEKILCDTCILIDFMNGKSQTLSQLYLQNAMLFINPIIGLELLQGARNKNEMRYLENKLEMFYKLDMPSEVFQSARELIEIYALSHGLRLADALIAATALVYELILFTLNTNDFKFIPKLQMLPIENYR
jgi:predicted nucleic acid-binding protein